MHFPFSSFTVVLCLFSSTQIVELDAALEQMSQLLTCALDIEGIVLAMNLGLMAHGCFCGHNKFDTPNVEPVDEMDQCCKIHDRCYSYANLTEICLPMKCPRGSLGSAFPKQDQHQVYCEKYETSCVDDRMTPSCHGSSLCGSFICNCDLAFSLCIRETYYGYYGGRGKWKSKKCTQKHGTDSELMNK